MRRSPSKAWGVASPEQVPLASVSAKPLLSEGAASHISQTHTSQFRAPSVEPRPSEQTSTILEAPNPKKAPQNLSKAKMTLRAEDQGFGALHLRRPAFAAMRHCNVLYARGRRTRDSRRVRFQTDTTVEWGSRLAPWNPNCHCKFVGIAEMRCPRR